MKYLGLLISLVLLSLSSDASNRTIRTDKVRNVYVTKTGIYKVANNNYTSIYIPRNIFKGYQYITVKANKEHSTRVHFLKEEPTKDNEPVQYSDYYKESILVRKGIDLNIVIPRDAKCIYILNSSGNNNKPDVINIYTADSLFNISNVSGVQNLTRRAAKGGSQKFMHWNIGNFSQGKYPYSDIKKNSYRVRLDGFNNFINTYCPDCHYLLNEYNDIFARVNGKLVKTATVLFDKRNGYKVFPRSTSSGYNRLAIFWKEGLLSYKYGIFESLKGVKNSNGTLEYGAGYCISQYSIGGEIVYVMSLHAPNRIKGTISNELYKEILCICSKYDNFIIVGDLNRNSADKYSVLTNAGFKILNDKSVTYPPKRCLDWVLYRCKSVTLSDFRVYPEAIDSNGDLLSDHLPLSFMVTSKR